MPWDIWLIFFVLGVIVPWRGRARLQSLLAKSKVEPAERLSLYASTIAFQWLAVTVAGLRVWATVGASAILFGLAHLYQGRGGFVGTSLLGVIFGVVRAIYGSLVPVVVWHAAVDVVAGIAGPKYLIRTPPDAQPDVQP